MEKLEIGTRFISVYGKFARYNSITYGAIGYTTGEAYWSPSANPPGWVYPTSFKGDKQNYLHYHEQFMLPIPKDATPDQIEALRDICGLRPQEVLPVEPEEP